MASKNVTQVLIGGKIYTLSGYESEEYLQRVAGYLNTKITEMKAVGGFNRMSPDMRSLMLNLNVADDYFKLKKQADQMNDQIAQKDKELYEIKHELIQTQMKLESMTASVANYQDSRVPSGIWPVQDDLGDDSEENDTEELIPMDEDELPPYIEEDAAAEEEISEYSSAESEETSELPTDEETAPAQDLRTPEEVLTPSVSASAPRRGIPAPPDYTGSRRGRSGKNRNRR